MYKLSVPISLQTLNETSLPIFVEEFRKAEVERVFLCDLTAFHWKDSFIRRDPEKMAKTIAFFKQHGFEVGVWEGCLGHGSILLHADNCDHIDTFTKIRGADGQDHYDAICPLDEKFLNCYEECIQKLAAMHPDLIMFDDDFRLNKRGYNLGCCCDLHLKQFYEAVGEEIPLEKIEETVFSGGENRYRTAWLRVMGASLENFAKRMRAAVDEVDDRIRLGCCICMDTWDYSGTDGIALAKAFAGKTRPFLRTIGAPYHSAQIQNAVEMTRLQIEWCRGEGIELFTEGDVYPRPRYRVPSRYLELFDLALLADGGSDGILKYMFDYRRDVTYEMGYVARHVKNKPLRDGICALFGGKKSVGVRVFEAMHKAEKFVLPEPCAPGEARFVEDCFHSRSQQILSENAIPSTYLRDAGGPAIVFGENARHIPEEELYGGAVLDLVAARILTERGIDVGLLQAEPASFRAEYFPDENDSLPSLGGICAYRVQCAESAVVKSTYEPGGTAAAYCYANEKGMRFYVLAVDMHRSAGENRDYLNSYHRQRHLIDALEWVSGKALPAVCTKHPFLYLQAARSEDGKSMAVALFNCNIDEVLQPEVVLDRPYAKVTFLNGEGTVCGNVVHFTTEIEPYGMAAFEVTE